MSGHDGCLVALLISGVLGINQERRPQNPNQQKGAGPCQTADVKRQSRGFFNLRK